MDFVVLVLIKHFKIDRYLYLMLFFFICFVIFCKSLNLVYI